MEKVTYQYLGLKDYQETWDYQKVLLKEVIDRKLNNRHLAPEDPAYQTQQHHLLFWGVSVRVSKILHYNS